MWNNHPNSPTIKWIDTDMKKKKIVGAIKKKKTLMKTWFIMSLNELQRNKYSSGRFFIGGGNYIC